MAIVELRIEGMHCNGCVTRVSQAMQKAGAAPEAVTVGHARVRYDEAGLPLATLISALGRMGFVARVDNDTPAGAGEGHHG